MPKVELVVYKFRMLGNLRLAFAIYCFISIFMVGVNLPFIAPPLLQSLPYCITIARPLRNIRPATDSFFLCNTPYNIGDGNIV